MNLKPYIQLALIIAGALFLIHETAHFIAMQGIPAWLCWSTAIMLEGGCLVTATYKDKTGIAIVAGFVIFVLAASSYGRIDPILTADKTTTLQNKIIQSYEADITSLENQLNTFKQQKQKLNTAATSRELNKKRADRTAALKQISQTPQAATGKIAAIARTWGIVALRLFVQLFNIFLAGRLTFKQTQPTQPATQPQHNPAGQPAPQQADHHPEIDQPEALKLYNYIDQRGGNIRRRQLISSRVFKNASEADTAINHLRELGCLTISQNGKVANTTYSI